MYSEKKLILLKSDDQVRNLRWGIKYLCLGYKLRNSIHVDWLGRNGLILELEGMYDLDLFEIEQIIGEHNTKSPAISRHLDLEPFQLRKQVET